MRLVEDKVKQTTEVTQKILIADDDPPTRILLRAAVAQWGYDVVEAQNGEEAWEILQQANAPALLILDWLMPKLDGIALCTRVRQELKNYHYIILLTQVSGTTNIVKGLEAGADEFLSKPFNMAELRSRLSVGTRMINYERELLAQNNQVQNCVSQMVTLGALLLNVSQKIDDILKNNASLEAEKNNTIQLQKMEELHCSLKHIAETIKNFQLDLKT